jgi:hypothetical protein
MFHPRSNVVRLGILAIVLGTLVAWVSCQRTPHDFTPEVRQRDPNVAPVRSLRSTDFIRQIPLGQLFDTGVSGRVVWSGDIPDVPPIRGLITTKDGIRWAEMPNHFAPKIDLKSRGIADAVVYLKAGEDVDWKTWPMEVEQSNFTIRVRQGSHVGRIGFFRVGSEIEMVSRDAEYHSLRARGVEYFTLPFPEPNQPIKRILDTPGHVEFTSAAGYFWSAADVFVCEHPYYTTTDAEGRFDLKNVPPGEYELVAWLRNWQVLDRERDPETGRIMRVKFAEPFQQTRKVTVEGGKLTEVRIEFPPNR